MEQTFNRSSHLESLAFRDCKFGDLTDLNFQINSQYSLKTLDFTGISKNGHNSVEAIVEIIRAISRCNLKNSLKKIKLNFDEDHLSVWQMALKDNGLSEIELVNSS